MEAQELVNALKRRGYTIGPSAISPEGGLLINVNGRLMKYADAERLVKDGNSKD